MAAQQDLQTVFDQTDVLYTENKWKEAFDILSPYADNDPSDVELLWRLVRVFYRISKFFSKDKEEMVSLAKKGLELSKKALTIDDKHFQCQKWGGIMLSYASDLGGQKEKIASAFLVKEHFEKAIELNAEDMSVHHLLGRWHFKVASVPWYLRRAASLVYANPPSSTYQEVLVHLEAAERLNKDKFFMNWLYLGKTHYALGDKQEAKKWISKVVEHDIDSPEFIETKEEAVTILKKL